MDAPPDASPPEGIWSILDTDLYKLTMQCAVHQYFPKVPVTYRFTNRTSHMKLSEEAFSWLKTQISKLANVVVTKEELQFLHKTCGYLERGDYLDSFLPAFRFDPTKQVDLQFTSDKDRPGFGDVSLEVKGQWEETILYEIPLLALTSEAYFRFVDRDWTYDQQEEKAYAKGEALIKGGAIFSEFGTRRRRDYKTQDLVLRGLARAHKDHAGEDAQSRRPSSSNQMGKLAGSSNVHFAMKHGVPPVGTMAHEWFMGIAAATQDYKGATALGLARWVECFGRGVLGIALTDTFGTPVFLESFTEPLPESMRGLTEGWLRNPPSFADVFAGTRQDSGDPRKFIKLMRRFYDANEMHDRKTIVFSDSLTVDNALLYKRLAEKRGFAPSFGIGTFLTNDFNQKSNPGEKSKPLNIVIKISSAGGHPAVKLSDDLGKNTGDSETVMNVKRELGYIDRHWEGANEKDRYGKGVIGEDVEDSEDEDE